MPLAVTGGACLIWRCSGHQTTYDFLELFAQFIITTKFKWRKLPSDLEFGFLDFLVLVEDSFGLTSESSTPHFYLFCMGIQIKCTKYCLH